VRWCVLLVVWAAQGLQRSLHLLGLSATHVSHPALLHGPAQETHMSNAPVVARTVRMSWCPAQRLRIKNSPTLNPFQPLVAIPDHMLEGRGAGTSEAAPCSDTQRWMPKVQLHASLDFRPAQAYVAVWVLKLPPCAWAPVLPPTHTHLSAAASGSLTADSKLSDLSKLSPDSCACSRKDMSVECPPTAEYGTDLAVRSSYHAPMLRILTSSTARLS
jgi:hypothetical protein